MATTTAATIPTVAQRFAAQAAQRDAERGGSLTLVRALRSAAWADGFPHSYTDEAVRVGRALIVAVAEEGGANADAAQGVEVLPSLDSGRHEGHGGGFLQESEGAHTMPQEPHA